MVLNALPEGDPNRPHIEEVRKAGARAADLTRQLLAYGRKQILRPRPVDLGALVSDLGAMLDRLIGEDVELSLRPGRAGVRADPGQLTQVVMNLVVNARDAMPAGGQLRLTTRVVFRPPGAGGGPDGGTTERHALLEVADTGCGMTEAVRARAFEPFFTTKPTGEGTGLGLATVYGIVQQSGGHVEVESAAGCGTTVRVYLPAVEAPAPPGVERPTGSAPGLKATETILLVEDDDDVRALAVRVLRGEGYAVVDAASGESAMGTVATYGVAPDVLVTDVVMPGMGGSALADRLHAALPGLKVLYVSGYTDDAVLRHGVERNAVHFLPKPFTPGELARKVREVLDTDR